MSSFAKCPDPLFEVDSLIFHTLAKKSWSSQLFNCFLGLSFFSLTSAPSKATFWQLNAGVRVKRFWNKLLRKSICEAKFCLIIDKIYASQRLLLSFGLGFSADCPFLVLYSSKIQALFGVALAPLKALFVFLGQS